MQCYFLAVIGFMTVFFVSRVLAPLLRQHPAAGSQAAVPGGCCSSVPLPQVKTHQAHAGSGAPRTNRCLEAAADLWPSPG